MSWNLADLFCSVQEYENSKSDLIESLRNKEKSSATIEFLENAFAQYELLDSYIKLNLAQDRSNTYYSNEEQNLLLINTQIKNAEKELAQNVDKPSGENDTSNRTFYISRLKRMISHLTDDKTERMISDMERINGSNWSSLRKISLQSAKSSYGKSLCAAQALLLENDENIRRQGLDEEKEICLSVKEVSCRAMNAIKAENHLVAKARGYSSVLDMVLYSEGISRRFIDNSLNAIGRITKNILKGVAVKQRRIGADSFKWYNINYISNHNNILPLSFPNAIEVIKRAFHNFSPEAGEIVEHSICNNLINYEKNETKRSGAFCTNIAAKNSTYIMLTYSENLRSFISLAHELGHSVHYSLMNKYGYFASAAPITLKESVAQLFEILACNELCKVHPEHCKQIYEMQLTSLSSTLIDVQSRYLFEKDVSENCGSHYFTPDELTELMLSKQKYIIGDLPDEDAYNPTTWISKPHFYYSDRPYYNFPYMIGRLLSYHMYEIIKTKNVDKISGLISMIEESGKCLLSESLKKIGIESETPDWSNAEIEINTISNHFFTTFL